MYLQDLYNSRAQALYYTNEKSNREPYLGPGYFPPKKKVSDELAFFKGHKGLPVSLMPSVYDAMPSIRDRIGVAKITTEMPMFRESMVIKEKIIKDLKRVQESGDPLAQQIIGEVMKDGDTLLQGADVVPEREIWQLLAAINGEPRIRLSANNVPIDVNYDPEGTWKAKNYLELAGTSMWSDHDNATPLDDIEAGMDMAENASGTRPTTIVMSQKTINDLVRCKQLRDTYLASNSGIVRMSKKIVKQVINEETGLTVVVYTKSYKDEKGVQHNFYPDGYTTLLPDGELGNTWYAETIEESELRSDDSLDISIVNEGVAIVVERETVVPFRSKTTVSEIVLPSFERMDEVAVIKTTSAYD